MNPRGVGSVKTMGLYQSELLSRETFKPKVQGIDNLKLPCLISDSALALTQGHD